MHIRTIHKYKVIKRFSFCKKMYDIAETIYIQEQDLTHEDPQKVFGREKEYLTDISSEVYDSLCQGFIVRDNGTPSYQNKS
ncbi:hypothetical protein PY092_15930 [Muricauda sp. 334s03]|uniref:Uncharacterized protein n=1 Tax=Flagellimonas yonaguniensis TaxID=3031325 RepID=A0ABT5Y2H7_9FLAO|nr:hypothetical protein [[Muricauda] yonaguniensis]MDF0717653.1 hypothetical protein [[Muricauda] yonaguniensis]